MLAFRGNVAPCALLALVIIISLDGNSMVLAETCTPQTCPPDTIVSVLFENSDCTGQARYETIGVPIGMCAVSADESTLYFADSEGWGFRTYPGSTNCSANSTAQHYRSAYLSFGVCSLGPTKKRDSGTFAGIFNTDFSRLTRDELATPSQYGMYLPHVNASYEAPQEPIPIDQSYPTFSPVQGSCYSADNCTYNGNPAYISATTHTNESCLLEGATSVMIGNITAGECYSAGSTYYIRPRCIDENTYAMDQMIGRGCERIMSSEIVHGTCGEGSLFTVHCTNPPPPVDSTPPPPPSAAPTLAFSFLLIAFLFVASTLSY